MNVKDKKETFNPKLVHLLDCPACHYITRSIDQYLDHIHVNHTNQEVHFQISECEICHLKATNEEFLEEHIQFNHSSECKWRPITFVAMNVYNYKTSANCKFCTAILPNFDALNCHYQSYHKIDDVSSYLIYKKDAKLSTLQVETNFSVIKPEPGLMNPVISNIVSIASSDNSSDIMPPHLSPEKRIDCPQIQSPIPMNEEPPSETVPPAPSIDSEQSDDTACMQAAPKITPDANKRSNLHRELLALYSDNVGMSIDTENMSKTPKTIRQTSLAHAANSISQRARRSSTTTANKPLPRKITRGSLNDKDNMKKASSSRRSGKVRRSLRYTTDSPAPDDESKVSSDNKKDSERVNTDSQNVRTRSRASNANNRRKSNRLTRTANKAKNVDLTNTTDKFISGEQSRSASKRKRQSSEESVWEQSTTSSSSNSDSDSSDYTPVSPNKFNSRLPRRVNRSSGVLTALPDSTTTKFQCPICKTCVNSFSALRAHNNRYHNPSNSKNTTSKSSNSSTSLEANPLEFKCNLCDKIFLRENGLIGHRIHRHHLNKDGNPFKAASLQSDFSRVDSEVSVEGKDQPSSDSIVKKLEHVFSTPHGLVTISNRCQLDFNQCAVCLEKKNNCNHFLQHMDEKHKSVKRERYGKQSIKTAIQFLRPIVKFETLESMLKLCEDDLDE